jgi:hypothetical protein
MGVKNGSSGHPNEGQRSFKKFAGTKDTTGAKRRGRGLALHHRNVRVAHWARATRGDTISVEIFYRDDGVCLEIEGEMCGGGTERGKKVLEL